MIWTSATGAWTATNFLETTIYLVYWKMTTRLSESSGSWSSSKDWCQFSKALPQREKKLGFWTRCFSLFRWFTAFSWLHREDLHGSRGPWEPFLRKDCFPLKLLLGGQVSHPLVANLSVLRVPLRTRWRTSTSARVKRLTYGPLGLPTYHCQAARIGSVSPVERFK